MWADTTLFDVDFSSLATEEVTTTSSSATYVDKTYSGYSVKFGIKSGKSMKIIDDGLEFTNNNYESYQHLAIPLTVTPSQKITVTITLTSSGKPTYAFTTGALSTPTKPTGTTPSTSATTHTAEYTPGTGVTQVNFIIGRFGSNSGKVIKSIVITQASAASSPAKTVYLKPNGLWNKDGARFAVYYWKSANTSDNAWLDMTSFCGPNFKATIPEGYDKFIFCRMNGAQSANNNTNKWNQTPDLDKPAANDTCYTIEWMDGDAYHNSTGSWGTYSCPDPTTIYLDHNSIWNADGARYAAYYWEGDDTHWVDFTPTCGNVFTTEIPSGYVNIILCRMNGSAAANNWDNKWNQTADQVTTGHDGQKFTISNIDGSGSWGAYSPTTYTISYAANGGGSSMSATSGICPNANQAITSNAFTAPSGCASFSHWTANVNVTVGGATVTAGNPIANGATIQDINSDITLTAVWKLAAPTITDNGDNTFSISGSMAGSSYYYTTNGGTPTTSSSLYSSAVDFSAGEADITAKAIAHKDGYVDSDVASQACTYHAAVTCTGDPTALVSGTLYKVEDMASACLGEITSDSKYYYGLSSNGKFYVTGTTNANNSSTGTVEIKTASNTISGKTFSSIAWFKGAGTTTCRSIKFVVSAAGTLTVYGKTSSSGGNVVIKTESSSNTTVINKSVNGYGSGTADVSAGTYYVLSDGGSAAIVGLQFDEAVACTTVPTVTAGSNSSVASTTATVSCASGISSLGTGGCTITSYGFVIGTSANPEIDGSGVTQHEVGTTYTTTGTAFSKNLTGLTAETTYYVRPYATNGYGTGYGTQTSFTTSAAAATPIISWAIVTTSGQNWSAPGDTEDETNITNISNSITHAAQVATANGTKSASLTTAKSGTARDNNIYAEFSFKVACNKKLTPSQITCQVANVGSSSANKMSYDVILTDGTRSLSTTVTPTSAAADAFTDVTINNSDPTKYFQGNVTLRIYPYNNDGGTTGSAFRMGPDVKIFGEVGNQATPAATITWTTQPANGNVGDSDFAYAVSCSDGSTVTVTSNNTGVATIVGGKLHYAGAGTTYLVASATDACGNEVVQNSNNFTVSAAATYSITYNCDGADSGCPSNVAAATNLPSPLPTGLTKDGYDFVGWYTDSEKTVAAVAGAALSDDVTLYAKWIVTGSDCEDTPHAWTVVATSAKSYKVRISKVTEEVAIPVADATASNVTAYAGSVSTNDNVTVQIADGGSSKYGYKFDGSNTYLKLVFSTALVLNDTLVVDMTNASHNISFTTSATRATTYSTSGGKLLIPAALAGQTTLYLWRGSGSTMYLKSLEVHHQCAALTPCTTPVVPSLSNQTVCAGGDVTAWNATQTASLATGETASYKWQKKNGSNWDDISGATSATYDVSDAVTEAMEGTYRVVVTISKTGYASTSANREVTLTVTPATETPSVTQSVATVYPGNAVTLTATSTTGATWQWYTCSDAEGTGASAIGGATSASYAIASAPAAGTYYYKVTATGDDTNSCGSASTVYALVVSAAAGECETYYWFALAADATTNGVSLNEDDFFSGVTSGTNNASATFVVDGNNLTTSKATSNGAYSVTFTIPEGSTGDFYIYGAANGSSNPLKLIRTSDSEEHQVTNSSTVANYSVTDLGAGEWTLSCGSNKNWKYGAIAVKVCSTASCTDATPTAEATNTTVCAGSTLTLTATGYETSPTSIQWQKLNGSTWEDISGAMSATYTVASAAASNAGSYRVIVTKGCARTSNTVTIAVPSAPVFGDVPSSVSVMQTLALSISTVEASDATGYKWYKSADATYDAGTDIEIGTTKNLIKAYDSEATGSPSYYLFCVASNSCGSTTSSAIAVNVTAYVEEDCATKGNEGSAEFGFENTGCSNGSLNSTACYTTNSRSKYLTYTAPEGKYFDKAKVTVAVSSGSKCGYAYSTDGSTWTYAELTGLSGTLTEKTIELTGNITHFRISRNLQDGSSVDHGVTSGTFYLSKACFEYTESCTATEVVRSTGSASYDYTYPAAFAKPTFALQKASDHSALAGTLTYSSSNEDIATVDDDGDVDFTGLTGTVTITVAFAGGTISTVDYCASQTTYTITVNCSDVQPKITTSGSSITCQASITLNAVQQSGSAFADGTFQWYRDGVEIEGATSASYTATRAGIYTVSRTATCTKMSSNSANITSDNTEPEVTRLTPFQYYHVDSVYRATSIMRYRHLFTVKGSTAYGSTGKNFKMELSRNGGDAVDVTTQSSIVVTHSADNTVDTVLLDLNALKDKYTENDELVLTCKAIACGGAVSETYKESITVYVINKTKPTLALICSGADKDGKGTRTTSKMTVGGDFLTGWNPADLCQQTGKTSWDKNTEWGLYTKLKDNYIVTPVNGYAEFNKLNYEPFDILFLTDYPKASKSDAAATILDDMAELCDYRPLFSFKTHMVQKQPSKWAAKGFTTTPEVPKQSRLRLNIVCYAHPMFASMKTTSGTIQEDASDHTQLVYTMLSGAGYESSKGMQGFHIGAAENFVTIGLVHYNATAADSVPSAGYVTWTPGSGDEMLVAAAERQANIEARMVLFSLNAGAHSKLTATGDTVVLKCLEYLLDDDPLHVADCSFTFDNGAGNSHDASWYSSNCPTCTGTKGDNKWSTAANWGPDYVLLPGSNTDVRIAASVNVDIDDAKAMSVRIVDGGHITIPAGSALEVKSTIRRQDGTEISPTENEDIYIGSTASGNGTLIFNNNSGDSKATVAMYTTALADVANMSAATSTWQYIGTPHSDVASATYNYYDSWLYQYDTGTQGWVVIPNGGPLVPFRGYCVTHPQANHTFVMNGTLTATTEHDIDIPANKFVVVANSWTAPIYVKAITAEDMVNTREQSIYFFNTGSDSDQDHDYGTAAGTYVAVPIHASSYTGDSLISSMQGFYVVGGASDGTLHLDYERHVRPATTTRNIKSGPMHAPQRYAEENEPQVAKLFFRGSRYSDRLVVLERSDFSRGFDNGWDGEAWGGNSAAPYSCVSGEGRWDAVSAIPEYEGTVVGFRAGEDEEYRIDFEYSEENEPLYLLDTDNNTYTRVVTGNAYQFATTDKDYHDRFVFTRKAPSVATGVETTSDSSMMGRAKKLLIEDKLFILVDGALYDATGKVVK